MYRHLRCLVIAGVIAGSVSNLPAQASATSALPENYFPALGKILDQALQQSPRMVANNANVALAETNRISARSGQLPYVSGNFTYYPWDRQVRADQAEPLNVKRVAYGLSVNQPVFQWGSLKNTTRIGELQLKIAEGNLVEAYRLLAEEIRGQYLSLIIQKASLVRAQFNQKLADDALELARTKLEKHVIAEADMFSPTITAEQARLAADRAQSTYDDARMVFGRLYGAAALPDSEVPAEIPAVAPVSSTIQQLSREFTGQSINTIALENAKRAIDVEDLNYKVAKVRLLPRLSFVVGTSQDQQSYSINAAARYQVRDYYAGTLVYWNLFDGFATRAAKAASLIRKRQLEQAYKDLTADTLTALRKQEREIEYSARGLAISEKLFSSNTTYVRIREEDQGRGLASETEVQQARLSHHDSLIATFSARADYLMKVADFVSLVQQDPVVAKVPAHRR